MNALLVLYAGNLSGSALEPLMGEKNGLVLTIERAREFPGVAKVVLLAGPQGEIPADLAVSGEIQIERRDSWTIKALLETIAVLSESYDFTYFAWTDCPFLDPVLAGKLAERHRRFAAEYSYADGWPYGLAPELLSAGTAAILAKIIGDDPSEGGPVGRDALFSVLQKDINAFDIETEISPVDLRCHRLNLCADSRRNLLLLKRFMDCESGKIPDTAAVERIIEKNPEILRTLPAFYPVQVFGGCPQNCAFCPWPQSAGGPITERRDYMETGKFESLLEKITAFSGDAVIDLSLWGELSLHPQKMELIEMVLRRPELSLVLETSGIGWKNDELERSAELAAESVRRKSESVQKNPCVPRNTLPPLSWIISLDAADPARYKEIRGAGFAEANDCAKKLLSLFPHDAYVQAVRVSGAEEDIERFYRSWKEAAPSTANIIIQKYDDFCGALPKKQASDLSPVKRRPCWHLLRDMPVLIDGTVPLCRDQIAANGGIILGNAFAEPLEQIWERGQRHYAEQAGARYNSLCAVCDEYYTYNF
jgi:spiro-SPASM protein